MTTTDLEHSTGTDRFFDRVRDYREATRALEVTRVGSALHDQVAALVADLGPRSYDLTLRCMLCGGPLSFETTIAQYADLHAAPRGICGRH